MHTAMQAWKSLIFTYILILMSIFILAEGKVKSLRIRRPCMKRVMKVE